MQSSKEFSESVHANMERYLRCTVRSPKQDTEKASHLY